MSPAMSVRRFIPVAPSPSSWRPLPTLPSRSLLAIRRGTERVRQLGRERIYSSLLKEPNVNFLVLSNGTVLVSVWGFGVFLAFLHVSGTRLSLVDTSMSPVTRAFETLNGSLSPAGRATETRYVRALSRSRKTSSLISPVTVTVSPFGVVKVLFFIG